MGSDLFGSFADATCAALVIMASTKDLANETSLLFPLMISAAGIVACFLASIYGIYLHDVNDVDKIEWALKLQLLISTVLVLILLFFVSLYCLPQYWTMNRAFGDEQVQWWYTVVCAGLGLTSGFLIGMSNNYYTSNAHSPVKEMVDSCSSRPANFWIYRWALGIYRLALWIYRLALEALSTIIPVILLLITNHVSTKLLGMFGVALAAIGMLSTLSIGLAIDAYGPISDNAGGIAEMCQFGEEVRHLTDALDAAGNTTSAIGKGFAIGSAVLVSLALNQAFVLRAKAAKKNAILDSESTPFYFCSLMIGHLLILAFGTMTIKSVGRAAQNYFYEMREQIQNFQIRNDEIDLDYEKPIYVSTAASLKERIAPGLLVIVTPIFFGIIFHPRLVALLIPSVLFSITQMAFYNFDFGEACDNTKKLIETGTYTASVGKYLAKRTKKHKATVIGDSIGDPLKDTYGPSFNILIKLMGIILLVF
jgi:H(+)-translocating pyrophosphatase